MEVIIKLPFKSPLYKLRQNRNSRSSSFLGVFFLSWHVAQGGRFPTRGHCKASPSTCLFQQFEEQEVNLWPHLFPEDWVQWVKRSTRACYPDRRQRAVFKRKTVKVAREVSPRMESRLHSKRCFYAFLHMSHKSCLFPFVFLFSQISSWLFFFLIVRIR